MSQFVHLLSVPGAQGCPSRIAQNSLSGFATSTPTLFSWKAPVDSLVRLADDLTLADIGSDLGAPLIIVTRMGLGSLNAAELTAEAARHRGLHVLGLIGGSLPAQPDLATRLNVEEMPQVTGVPLLGCLPAGVGQLSREEFADRTSTIDADVMIQLFGTP